jgi:hypothetical protein
VLPVVGADGRPLDAPAVLDPARDGMKNGRIVDLPVQLPASDDAPALPMCLITQNKPAEAAAQRCKRAAKKAQRQHYKAKSKQIDATQYLLLMTTLDEAIMPAVQVLERHRWRRQIEIAFKRLKSLAGLDTVQVKEERLVTPPSGPS